MTRDVALTTELIGELITLSEEAYQELKLMILADVNKNFRVLKYMQKVFEIAAEKRPKQITDKQREVNG